jgi:DHA1 family tetracycline resistance protein-like MFS transporter
MPARAPSLGVIFLTVLLDLLGFGLVMPFLSLEARAAFVVDELTATALGAIYSAMQFVFMPLWGRLSDRIGRRPVMLISIAFSVLGMAGLGLALGFANSVLWLFVARAASGAATANIGTASAYIADITSPEDRVKGMGLIGMAFGIGFIIGPGVGGLLTQPIHGRVGPLACFVAAGLSLINLVWAYTSLPESLPPERRAAAASVRSAAPLRIDALARTLGTPGIGQAALTNGLIILAFSGLELTYALYAADTFGLAQRQVGFLFVYMGFIGALVQGLFMRRVSGKIRETSLTFAGLALMASGFLGFMVAPGLGLWALYLVSALIAIGNGFTQPSISAYISRLAHPARQGETLSSNQSMASLARTFGPVLAGALYRQAPALTFAVCAAIDMLALVIALGMLRVQPSPKPRPL